MSCIKLVLRPIYVAACQVAGLHEKYYNTSTKDRPRYIPALATAWRMV
jgi:hypothetical protein